MKIIIDGMGGDNAPAEIVKGTVEALSVIDGEIVLVGDEKVLTEELRKYSGKYPEERVSIRHASEVIFNEEAPVKAIRTKRFVYGRGNQHGKKRRGRPFYFCRSSGALMAGGLFILGRIQGIDRPAIASVYPILGANHPSLLVDAGANAECKPQNLLEFGVMGSIYMEKVIGLSAPRVGLVNLGAEETKGSTLTKAAYEMLHKSRVNFIGNVEARDVPKGICDVIVCDGFVGNVILKLTEGLAWNILKLLKRKFTGGAVVKMGAALLSGKMRELKNEFDYSEYGGAPILGVKGPIIKMHGSSSANGVKNTILKAIPYAENRVVQIIQNSVEELEEISISE